MSYNICFIFNAIDPKSPHNNDKLVICKNNCNEFKVVFRENNDLYTSVLLAKEVVSYCYNFFDALSMDENPTYRGFTVNIPGLPSILLNPSNLNEERKNKLCQWIGSCCDSWPDCKKVE